ncbi:CMRF35-like molecule 1 [Pleurodeles waltl]|uniref:CMRF35-like molecule 1 n=1 Tax=Pleurodeles waltl TaxID=8319 RepID=UPI00370955BF
MKILAILVLPILAECFTIEEKNYIGIKDASISVKCYYDPSYKVYVKYWCKGYYRASCTILRSTSQMPSGDIRIQDQATAGEMTVTMTNLRKEDTGWYWCGIERINLLDIMDYTHLNVTEQAIEEDVNEDELTWLYYVLTPLLVLVLLLFMVAVIFRRIKTKKNALGKISCQPKFEGKCPDIVITPPQDNSEPCIAYADIILNSKEQPEHFKKMDIRGKCKDGLQNAEYSEVVFRQ